MYSFICALTSGLPLSPVPHMNMALNLLVSASGVITTCASPLMYTATTVQLLIIIHWTPPANLSLPLAVYTCDTCPSDPSSVVPETNRHSIPDSAGSSQLDCKTALVLA